MVYLKLEHALSAIPVSIWCKLMCFFFLFFFASGTTELSEWRSFDVALPNTPLGMMLAAISSRLFLKPDFETTQFQRRNTSVLTTKVIATSLRRQIVLVCLLGCDKEIDSIFINYSADALNWPFLNQNLLQFSVLVHMPNFHRNELFVIRISGFSLHYYDFFKVHVR